MCVRVVFFCTCARVPRTLVHSIELVRCQRSRPVFQELIAQVEMQTIVIVGRIDN